ncbi:heavy metal translocating P-type ATPase [Anaerocaecibacter muris]|uniref:heavy metal translocating P-type ATPase n=1 Tax=Anaerocaecibacter muris TaxID=2941513 RepID=UPI003F68DE16
MSKNQRHLMRIIIAAVLFAAALALHMTLEDRAPVWAWLIVFVAVYLIISYDVLLRAGQNIIHGKIFDENFLMIVATAGAFCVFEFVEAVAVMLFYQVGEFFQNYAVNKSRKSIAALMDICPETARVATDDGGEITLDPSEVEIGSLVVVRAGEKVPIDGVVEAGDGYLDCSALTGESAPVAVTAGDVALSGSISTGGVLRVRTQKRYEDSAVSKILELVENASAKKARAENFITRFAAWYTPAVVIAALLLAVVPPLCIAYNSGAVWTDWVTRALTFLVVSCPCALVISVPMSFFGGIGAASKHGILVKGGNYLELLDRAGVAVFDKTGTITKGKFEVVSVACADGVSREEVVLAAARAEYSSLHPVAVSVVEAAKAYGFTPSSADSATELAGRGVVVQADGETIACGNSKLMSERGVNIPDGFISGGAGTVVYVARGERLLGAIEVADGLKEDSVAAIGALKAEGVKTVMLTGDNRTAAARVAAEAGVDEYRAELLPDMKVTELEAVIARERGEDDGSRRGKAVAFVGDGINDAPVLSRADVGIAMGALGSDAAIEAADIVLMNDSLAQIVLAKRIARKTVGIVKQNIIFALAVKAIVLVLAAFGIANMWLAVFADVGVAVLAILNAMRALNVKTAGDKRVKSVAQTPPASR